MPSKAGPAAHVQDLAAQRASMSDWSWPCRAYQMMTRMCTCIENGTARSTRSGPTVVLHGERLVSRAHPLTQSLSMAEGSHRAPSARACLRHVSAVALSPEDDVGRARGTGN